MQVCIYMYICMYMYFLALHTVAMSCIEGNIQHYCFNGRSKTHTVTAAHKRSVDRISNWLIFSCGGTRCLQLFVCTCVHQLPASPHAHSMTYNICTRTSGAPLYTCLNAVPGLLVSLSHPCTSWLPWPHLPTPVSVDTKTHIPIMPHMYTTPQMGHCTQLGLSPVSLHLAQYKLHIHVHVYTVCVQKKLKRSTSTVR